jgi:hypothetical protein
MCTLNKLFITVSVATMLLANPAFSNEYSDLADTSATTVAVTSSSANEPAPSDATLAASTQSIGPSVDCFYEINAKETVCAK